MSDSGSPRETDEERLIALAVDGDTMAAGRVVWPIPQAVTADGTSAARPPTPGTGRPLGRAARGISRRGRATCPLSGKREMPFFLWLRLVAGQRLLRIHREHLGAAMRDAGREVSLYKGALPQASSVSLAAQLLGHYTPASQALSRAEVQLQIQAALNAMEPIDREIIALRHFEELTNAEAAQVLELDPFTASKRYIRALKRLQATLKHVPDLIDRAR